ncbi:MAG: GTP-binding protein [Chlamydiota bacterium]|jgi:GTP-binding protein HflX
MIDTPAKETIKPGEGRLSDLAKQGQARALYVGTYKADKTKGDCEKDLAELERLGDTFGLALGLVLPCPLREIDPKTFLGKGKVEEMRQLVETHGCDLVVFDDEISPQQQRNLEQALARITIDRTELILGVFAERARTKEAKIQIELASCRYQLPRLKRLWTHLSRQRTGGAGGGYLKGEGEKQIEIDRRILKKRIDRLETLLKEVKRHRVVQRSARKKSKIPTFALVGYTNVGKSTLLKALTDADVLVEDKLFATLDTTTRQFLLPNKQAILLTDTVGFIQKIPHPLVAAFKSTLEEALDADILIHLIDMSHPSAEAQADATEDVLEELGCKGQPTIVVLNKIDALASPMLLQRLRIRYAKTVPISAVTKEGFDDLLDMMVREVASLRRVVHLRIPQSHYAHVSTIMQEGRIISLVYDDNDIVLEVEIPQYLERKLETFMFIPA